MWNFDKRFSLPKRTVTVPCINQDGKGKTINFTYHDKLINLKNCFFRVAIIIGLFGTNGSLSIAPAGAEGQLTLDENSYARDQQEQDQDTTHFDESYASHSSTPHGMVKETILPSFYSPQVIITRL